MSDDTGGVTVNQEALDALGKRLYGMFTQYEKDRFPMEQQLLRNIRQYRGLYDPDVKIRPNGSTAYPKFTRKWVNGTVSRLMQMLFPQSDTNWDIQPSPIPELGTQDLQSLLNEMQDSAQGQEIPDEAIEEQIKILAKAKCDRMRIKMQDQLDEMDYVGLARKVVFSGVLYGTGLLSGPLIKTETHRSWHKDIESGRYVVKEADRLAPWFEFESIWDWYPDLSAKTRKSQDGYYFRRVMSRDQVRKLAERPDFMRNAVVDWLKKNEGGNFRERTWESEIRMEGDRKLAIALNKRKYEVLEWWGVISGHELKAAGTEINEDELGNQFEANVWIIDNTVLKCIVNPMESQRRPLSEFVFEEDDLSLTGVGLPQVCRDSQLAICEIARMCLDNGSVICTPSKLIKMGLLLPGHSLDSAPYKDWYQDPDAADNSEDAVKNLTFDSHIVELQGLLTTFKGFGEEEVSLPPISMGDPSQGGSEGARTQGNLSMLMGAASLPIRDNVRNFDLFTDSAMTGLYEWNMEFDTDPKAKGDFNVVTLGSVSLVAKEVRAQHYVAFTQSIQPEERIEIDWRKFAINRMKTIDMVPDEVMADEKTVAANKETQKQQAQQQMALQMALAEAEVKKTLAEAVKSASLAGKADASVEIDKYQAILDGLDRVSQHDTNANDAVAGHVQALRDHFTQQQDLELKQQQLASDHINKQQDLVAKNRELDIKQQIANKPVRAAA